MCELKWDDIYVDASGRQLTYTFIGGKVMQSLQLIDQ